LLRVGQDIHWLIVFLKSNRESFLSLPEILLLQKLFSQHFNIKEQKICLKKDTENGKEKIQSPHEPEARYSKKRGKEWTGYKVHITETADPEGEVKFITDVTTTNACERDNETLPDIQKKLQERGVKPQQQFVDKGYTTGNSLADSREKDIQLMGEVSQLDNNGLFTADDFTIDYQNQTATCPAGKTSCCWKEITKGKHKGQVRISLGKQCQDCPMKEKCTKNKVGRRLRLHLHYDLLKERRKECQTDTFKKEMKTRPPVEGTISSLVRAHGIRRSRYRGILKTHLHNLLSSAALNLKRLVKRISLSENNEKQQLATI